MNVSQPAAAGPQPALKLEAVLQAPDWPTCVMATPFLEQIAAAVSRIASIDIEALAVVAFSSDVEVRSLNKQYREIDKPTNVLSFSSPDPVAGGDELDRAEIDLIGDIILARETVMLEAEELSYRTIQPVKDHTAHLIVHGILHLLGYDHDDKQDAEEMEALEVEILNELGIANPYTEELDDVG